jgi:hypothetical protein
MSSQKFLVLNNLVLYFSLQHNNSLGVPPSDTEVSIFAKNVNKPWLSIINPETCIDRVITSSDINPHFCHKLINRVKKSITCE